MSISTSWSSDRSPRPPPTRWPATSTEPEPPMAADPDGPTAWIVVSPDLDPLVSAHLEHAGGTAVGQTHDGDDWREALAWARARTDRVLIRFDPSDTTFRAPARPRPGTRRWSRCRSGRRSSSTTGSASCSGSG